MDKKTKRTLIIAIIIMVVPAIYALSVRGTKGSGTFFLVAALLIAGMIEVARDISSHKQEYKERYEKEQAIKAGTYVDKSKNAKKQAKQAYEAELNKKRNAKKNPKKLNKK